MSWITQSVTGRLSQIGGQLKDILTESTEDVVGKNQVQKKLNKIKQQK